MYNIMQYHVSLLTYAHCYFLSYYCKENYTTSPLGCLTSGKNQGKTKFSPGQGIVREFWKMSGNFCHLTHVRELSGNFVMTFF